MKITTMKKIGGAILGGLLLLAAVMVSGTATQAQYPNQNQRQRERERQFEIERQAELQRQVELQRQAEIDRNQQQRDGRWDNGRWDRNRSGRRGNRDGYPNLGGSYQLRQTALNAGYNEGMMEARKDRNHNDRFDFRDEGAYRSASKDYSSRLGDRYIYERYFRAAFENGYSDGYYGY